MKILLLLFYEFFKTGLFAVGGGMATLPFLSSMGERYGWFSSAQLADMIAVSESTPGPIGVNMATYVGYTQGGIVGAVVATIGLVAPSVIVILLIAGFLSTYKDNRYVQSAFYGLRPASVGLIASAGLSVAALTFVNQSCIACGLSLAYIINWKALALGVLLIALTRIFKKLHPAVFIAFSAVVGIVFGFAQ